ncbi:MAG: hypothetical protein K9G26_10165 [Emcibacter sp.]|nr:hypothetical protein [Emcibacter sp.]
MGNQQFGHKFYIRMGYVLIAFILAGFIPFIKMRFDHGGTMNPALMAHGISYLGWYILFILQASLIAKKNISLHMKLGKASLLLAAIMVITSILVMKDSFDRGSNGGTPFSPEHFIMLPFMDTLLFITGFSLAYINRKDALTHKHFMLLASILIMDPATARLAITLGFMPLGMLFHFGLLAAVIVYDKKTLGTIHKATKIGLALLVMRYTLFFTLGFSETWAKFVHMIF